MQEGWQKHAMAVKRKWEMLDWPKEVEVGGRVGKSKEGRGVGEEWRRGGGRMS